MDFLDVAATDGVLRNMIVLQTVLEEVKHRNLSVYKRLKTMVQTGGRNVFVFANEHHADTYSNAQPGESPNDRNDRCIRIAAAWFERQLQSEHVVELVTNDRECRSRALEQGLKCQTLYDWAKANLPAKYLENIAQSGEGEDAAGTGEGGEGKEGWKYPAHLSAEQIQEGVRSGRLLVGTLHMARDNATEGWVIPQANTSSGPNAPGTVAVYIVRPLPPWKDLCIRHCVCMCAGGGAVRAVLHPDRPCKADIRQYEKYL